MPSVSFYNSPAQREALKNTAHGIGESTIHDDHVDSGGNPTNGNSGRLTFDVKLTTLTPDQVTIRTIIEKIETDQSLSNLEERDFRKLYHIRGIR